jgi:hypothetical protein
VSHRTIVDRIDQACAVARLELPHHELREVHAQLV